LLITVLMVRLRHFKLIAILVAVALVDCAGCGTTRSTDTTRTATEQLLISDAIDRAVQSMNLQTLAGQTVYLDDSKLSDTVDRNYYISTLRQQLLASGCELRDTRDEAEFVVEARAGAIGTDRNDLLFGLPSMNVPQIPLVQPVPAAIPEIPIAKRKDQRGVAKIAVFAYHRATGTPVWQSGIVRQESSANDVWIFGAGPFQRGTIYDGTTFAGNTIGSDIGDDAPVVRRMPAVSVSKEATFTPPKQFAEREAAASDQNPKVALATHQESVAIASNAASPPAATATPVTGPMPPAAAAQQPVLGSPAAAEMPHAAMPKNSAVATAPAKSVSGPPGNSEPQTATPAGTIYARAGDDSPLPQPRFNSPR
jgi:hypothetical protein